MNQEYDAIIVGAGPAGGQCARELAGHLDRVLLVDKAKSFAANNYSSGGAPLQIMQDFNLPPSLVGTYWHQLCIHTSYEKYQWQEQQAQGVILDFQKLREFLAQDAQKKGAELKMEMVYQNHLPCGDKTIVYFKNRQTQQMQTFKTRLLVDATGTERKVLMGGKMPKHTVSATGLEWLIMAKPEIYEEYANTLSLFLGPSWMPQGYGWVFPMQPPFLKIGVIRYFPQQHFVDYEESYRFYLESLVNRSLHNTAYEVIDRHGKTLYYSIGQKDCLFTNQTIAIGDAISSLNPMACEGIRHAMVCGRIAAKHILNHLQGKKWAFGNYRQDLNCYFGYRWVSCERIMHHVYKMEQDAQMQVVLQVFKGFRMKEIMQLAFDYPLRKVFKFFFKYLWLRTGQWVQKQWQGLWHAKSQERA